MRMVTIPNQSSVAKAFNAFDDAGQMRASPHYNHHLPRNLDMSDVVLHGWPFSPYLRAVRLALVEAGVTPILRP